MNAITTLDSFSLKDIHGLRNPIFNLTDRVKWIVQKLTELRNRKDLHLILSQFFSDAKYNNLRVFFEQNPSAWWDFIRKLNKHKKERNEEKKTFYIDETKIADIMETLLIRWRKADIGATLVSEMRASLSNPSLLRFASRQPSILDGSWYSFSGLDRKSRGESVTKLITAWLTNNIDDCKESNVEDYFREVFPQIIFYLWKIFWRKYDFPPRVRSIKECVSILQKMFQSPEKVEDAWMIVQSFYAWPRVNEILEICSKAKWEITKMPKTFESVGITIGKISMEEHITGATIYHSEVELEGKKYGISWRVKTPESILQKMWQKSQYNNVDAMRDIIGMNIIYPDNTSEAEKKALIRKFSGLMPDFWYILKNKWAVDKSEWLTEGLSKTPIAIKEDKSEMTRDDFTNMSLSWYITLWKVPYWAEIQFMSQSEANSKKEEDPYYKLRWALDAFFRWPKYRTPSDLNAFIEERIGVNYLRSLKCDNYWDLYMKLIEDDYLIAYRFSQWKEFIFTIKWKEDAISEIFPDAAKITKSSSDHYYLVAIKKYVRNDFRMRNNDALTTFPFWAQPPSRDQSWPIFAKKGEAKPSK